MIKHIPTSLITWLNKILPPIHHLHCHYNQCFHYFHPLFHTFDLNQTDIDYVFHYFYTTNVVIEFQHNSHFYCSSFLPMQNSILTIASPSFISVLVVLLSICFVVIICWSSMHTPCKIITINSLFYCNSNHSIISYPKWMQITVLNERLNKCCT